jgi:hypothetical protein
MADSPLRGNDRELARGRAMRLEADRRATMSQRLARVHHLCKQDRADLANLPEE